VARVRPLLSQQSLLSLWGPIPQHSLLRS
jgi:hypothetical protein